MKDEASKEKIMELFERIKKYDAHALALELSSMAISFTPFVNVEQMTARLAELSTACRRMKKSQTRNNKAHRLKALCDKKRLTKKEHEEALKLCKELKIKF